jgi:hypothetical protein
MTSRDSFPWRLGRFWGFFVNATRETSSRKQYRDDNRTDPQNGINHPWPLNAFAILGAASPAMNATQTNTHDSASSLSTYNKPVAVANAIRRR